GNSNNFSTVDIAVGFVGVETYQPIQIAVQILLSTYSGPLLTAFGWWQYLVEESVTSISLSHKRNSLLCWISSVLQLNMSLCLLSLYIQRYHLFVYSIKDYPSCDISGFLQSNDKLLLFSDDHQLFKQLGNSFELLCIFKSYQITCYHNTCSAIWDHR
ncbi:unnamed protein product, partial [Wuchereria bancrofti]